MFQPDLKIEAAYKFSRFDEAHLLSSVSPHAIELDGDTWKTSEHYVQANLFVSESYAERIKQAGDGKEAFELGKCWYRRKIKGWKSLRRVLMTRALYTKCQMYSNVKEAILETNDQDIVETSLYDHYWGIGRDQRGENVMGKVWMDIRSKLLSA